MLHAPVLYASLPCDIDPDANARRDNMMKHCVHAVCPRAVGPHCKRPYGWAHIDIRHVVHTMAIGARRPQLMWREFIDHYSAEFHNTSSVLYTPSRHVSYCSGHTYCMFQTSASCWGNPDMQNSNNALTYAPLTRRPCNTLHNGSRRRRRRLRGCNCN